MLSGDAEPNNVVAQALNLAHADTMQGRIGYSYYANDASDWYCIVMPHDGLLSATVEFQDQGRVYLKTTTGTTLSSPAGNGAVTVSRSCVAAGDTFYLQVAEYQAVCNDYSIYFDVLAPEIEGDAEPNNSKANAAVVLDVQGTINGHIRYGYYGSDVADYFDLGILEIDDSMYFNFSVTSSPVTFELYRKGTNSVVQDFGTVADSSEAYYIAPVKDRYYLYASATNCTAYQVGLSGCISYLNYSDITINGYRQAKVLITGENLTIGTSTMFSAPCVRLDSNFEVPPGKVFETSEVGCE